jgi:hypothetical protein
VQRELYGYAASQQVALLLARRVGADGLSKTFAAMLEDEAAYQPLDGEAAETSYSHQNDWRYLLDVLEERTGQQAGDIVREWVVGRTDGDLLDERVSAREEYAALVERLAGWDVPGVLRQQMGAWAFDRAADTIAAALPVIERREALQASSAELGLAVSLDSVASPFETGDFARAASAADRVATALDVYADARDAGEAPVDVVEMIGLIGADPQADLASAADGLEAGRWDEAQASARSADATWRGAAGAGTVRLGIGGGAGAVLLLGVGGLGLIRRRRAPAEHAAGVAD